MIDGHVTLAVKLTARWSGIVGAICVVWVWGPSLFASGLRQLDSP